MSHMVSTGPGQGPAASEGRLPVTAVWTALVIETGTALVIAASLAGWAHRHFTAADPSGD